MFKSDRLKKVSNAFKSPKTKGESSRSANSSPVLGSSTDAFKSVSGSLKTVKMPLTQSSESRMFNNHIVKYSGIKGKIIATAFDHTQSLMAVATDLNEIHVFGKDQVEVVFTLSIKGSIRKLHFVKGIYLVAVDSKDTILVLSIYSKKVLTTVFVPSHVTCIETDPSMDWIILGLQNGIIMIYDVDRNCFSNVKIENLQKTQFFPKEVLSPVNSITWNPRDLGTLLISYNLVTVSFSFVDMEIKQSFVYELPPFAPGGDAAKGNNDTVRKPNVIQSLYHPNSLNILTVHEDNSLVFWDANSAQLIEARSLFETEINEPRGGSSSTIPSASTPRIFKVYWVCDSNPENTSLIVATKGLAAGEDNQGVTILDFGSTPLYTITSYENMRKYYADPKHQKVCPLVNRAPLVDILPLPRASPYFSGCHDPAFALVLLEDGQIETLITQSGSFTSKASLLPQSLSWTRPLVTTSSAFSVPKKLWLGLMTSNSTNESILKGGTPAGRNLRSSEIRTAIATGHTNGSVRLWDGAQDELDDKSVFEVNVGRILNRGVRLSIDKISFAAETLEMAVATEVGEVLLFKFETNQFFNQDQKNSVRELDMNFRRFSIEDARTVLIDVRDRAPATARQGFMPSTIVNAKRGQVTALCNGNVGFVGIGYSSGDIIILDRRGPAIIYMEQVQTLPKAKGSCITSINFSIMEFGEDGYSSILMFCGTDYGELITFKILPGNGGRFTAECVDLIRSNDNGAITGIETASKISGISCEATISRMQELSKGLSVPGYVVVAGTNDIRTLKPGKSKESHRSYKYQIVASGLTYFTSSTNKLLSYFTCVLANGSVKVLSVPDLKEVKSMEPPMPINSRYVKESAVIKNGDIFMRTNTYSSVLLSIVAPKTPFVPGSPTLQSNGPVVDVIYNPNMKISFRPQVNSLQWARGTVYCTADQLDDILGGGQRPESKYKESAIARGTISLEPKPNEEHHYQKPVRHAAKHGGYGYMKGVSRVMENQWDSVETQFNDYATAVGQSMNDAMEQTGKDIVKGSFGL